MPSSVAAASLAAWLAVSSARQEFLVPPACGDEASFASQLQELGGADAEDAPYAGVHIEGPNVAGRYTLRLEMEHETRVLEDASCETLLRSAAVILAAAAADPERSGGEALPAAEPEPEPPPPSGDGSAAMTEPPAPVEPKLSERPTEAPRPTAPAGPEPPAAARRAKNWTGGLGLGAGLVVGLVPRVGARLELLGDLAFEPWALRFMVHAVPPARTRDGDASVEVLAVGGRIAARRRLIRALHLGLGAEVDWLRGRGVGVPDPRTAHLWMVSPLLELTAVPLDRPGVRLEIGAVLRVATTRPRFDVLGRGALYQVAPVSFLATIRGVWKIP